MKAILILAFGLSLVSCSSMKERGPSSFFGKNYTKMDEKQFFKSFSEFLDIDTTDDHLVRATYKGFRNENSIGDTCEVKVSFKKFAFWSGNKPEGDASYQVFIDINDKNEEKNATVWLNFESKFKLFESNNSFEVTAKHKKLSVQKVDNFLKFQLIDSRNINFISSECFLSEKAEITNDNS